MGELKMKASRRIYVASFLVLLAINSCKENSVSSEQAKRLDGSKSALEKGQEFNIRKYIYEGKHLTAFPKEGKYAGFTILIVPREIESIYESNKLATVQLLITIIDGARPEDSLLAAGYAASLLLSPIEGAEISCFPKDKYDSLNEVTGETQRSFVVSQIKEMKEKISDRD
jgi:hypothetical protein